MSDNYDSNGSMNLTNRYVFGSRASWPENEEDDEKKKKSKRKMGLRKRWATDMHTRAMSYNLIVDRE